MGYSSEEETANSWTSLVKPTPPKRRQCDSEISSVSSISLSNYVDRNEGENLLQMDEEDGEKLLICLEIINIDYCPKKTIHTPKKYKKLEEHGIRIVKNLEDLSKEELENELIKRDLKPLSVKSAMAYRLASWMADQNLNPHTYCC